MTAQYCVRLPSSKACCRCWCNWYSRCIARWSTYIYREVHSVVPRAVQVACTSRSPPWRRSRSSGPLFAHSAFHIVCSGGNHKCIRSTAAAAVTHYYCSLSHPIQPQCRNTAVMTCKLIISGPEAYLDTVISHNLEHRAVLYKITCSSRHWVRSLINSPTLLTSPNIEHKWYISISVGYVHLPAYTAVYNIHRPTLLEPRELHTDSYY